jgi:hypothetical protein
MRTETAPTLLMVWGPQAPVIASLITCRPALGARLMLAPKKVIHALSAYVQASMVDGRDTASTADDLLTRDIRQLLARAVPNPHPRLFQLLDRLDTPAKSLDAYQRMNSLLHGPGGKILLDSPAISVGQLALIEGIAADPVLVAGRKAIGCSDFNFKLLASTLAFLRASKLAAAIEELPDGAGWQAICRRIKADLGRAQAPKPPFRIPEGWGHVTDIATLWHAGRELGNCVSGLSTGGNDHLRNLLSGAAVYVVSIDKPIALAAIENVGPGLWTMGDVGPRVHSEEVRDKLIKGLTESLAETGQELLENDPMQAMHTISWRVERANDGLDGLDEAA